MSDRGHTLRAVLYTAVVFCAGMVAGAMLMNLREHYVVHPSGHVVTPTTWLAADRAHYIEQFKTQLQLTEPQTRQLEAILDETMRQYHDLHTFSHHIRGEGIARIRTILDDNQRKRFDEITKKMEGPLEQKKGQKQSR